MAYIRNGRVVEKPTGIVAIVRAFFAAIIAFLMLFLQSIINPETSSNAKKDDGSSRRGPGGGPGGGPRGPRITGLDRITGGSHAAQCNSGG